MVFLLGSFLIALLVSGGTITRRTVFGWNTTVSIVVEFIGGIYFITKLIRERKRTMIDLKGQ